MRSSWLLVALLCMGLALSAWAGAAYAHEHSRVGGSSTTAAPMRHNASPLSILAGAPDDTLVLEVARERPEGDALRLSASWTRPATAVLVPPGLHSTRAAVEALREGAPVPGALASVQAATSLEAEVPLPHAPFPAGDHATWGLLGVVARDVVHEERDPSRSAPTLEERRSVLDLGLRTTQSAVLVLRFGEPVPEGGEPVSLRVETYRQEGERAARWLLVLSVPFVAGAVAAGAAALRARGREAREAPVGEDEPRLLEGALRHAASLENFLRQTVWASRLLAAGLVLLALVALQALVLLRVPVAAGRLPLAGAAGSLVFVAFGAACLGVAWSLHVRRVRRESVAWRRRFERVGREQERWLDDA